MVACAPLPSAQVLPFVPRQSFGKRVAVQSGQSFDLVRFYADFPDRWMAFLRAHFPSPVAVAHHFGVTERAAEKWWNGVGGPRGDKLAVALVTVPGAFADLLVAA
jgi:hypothetical protein